MKTKWTKDVPKKDGWYWIKYKGKKGVGICPAQVYHWKDSDNDYSVTTAKNDIFTATTRKCFGFSNAKFGNKIAEPK